MSILVMYDVLKFYLVAHSRWTYSSDQILYALQINKLFL